MIDFHTRTKDSQKRILFCEEDERVVQAARKVLEHGLVPVLVGEFADFDVEGLERIDIRPETYVDEYFELRKHKGISREDAQQALMDPAFFSCMLLADGKADGLVCGASWPTANTLRPAIHILRDGLASSYFFIGKRVFADCAINVQPDASQLSEIAINTARAVERFGVSPRIAMLSFSTVGSASHPDQQKVMQAANSVRTYIKEHDLDWVVDGEFQVDAAINPGVAKRKAPDSPLQGDANVLIFPDLDAGNIGYKLVQQYTGVDAVGPIITGFSQPVNDLSRGCSVEEIVDVACITAYQSTQQD